jgi:MinD-like ATPase involved in chromosome partitioning or flagellar assembly
VRIAFALPVEVEDRLATDAVRHGHELVARCSTAHELASRIDAAKPEVAVVAATERHLTESLVTVCDEAGVRIVSLAGSDADRRRAADLRLDEPIDLESSWPEVEKHLTVVPMRVSEPPPSIPPPTEHGVVIAVWGPAGAPGRTTVAINLAAELALAGQTVALADADTYSGSVAPSLGMLDEAPGFAAACRLAGADSLDRAELQRIAQRYGPERGGFDVLTGIGRPSRWPELSASRVSGSLQRCREWADFTVVDTGFSLEADDDLSADLFAPRRNAAGIAALREADRVVAVGAADPVGLSRFLRAHVDLLETVRTDRVLVAMNKLRASAIGLNPVGQVTQTLARFGGIQSAAMIPWDPAALDAAALTGRTLADVAPRSAARVAVRDLVASHLLPAPAVRAKRRTPKAAAR